MADIDDVLNDSEIVDKEKISKTDNIDTSIEEKITKEAEKEAAKTIAEETTTKDDISNTNNNVMPHEWEMFKSQYWDTTIPEVSKELNLPQDNIRNICRVIGIDSPDILVKLKNDVSLISNKTVLPDDNINNLSNNKKLKIDKEKTNTEVYNSSRKLNWTQIAENIKRDKGIL